MPSITVTWRATLCSTRQHHLMVTITIAITTAHTHLDPSPSPSAPAVPDPPSACWKMPGIPPLPPPPLPAPAAPARDSPAVEGLPPGYLTASPAGAGAGDVPEGKGPGLGCCMAAAVADARDGPELCFRSRVAMVAFLWSSSRDLHLTMRSKHPCVWVYV